MLEWYSIWEGLPAPYRDVYSHPRYHEICAVWESVSPECLYLTNGLTNGRQYALYSYLRYPVREFCADDQAFYDVQTPYGYGGPLFVGDWTGEEKIGALLEIKDYLESGNVIAEFIRCNPDRYERTGFAAAGYRVVQVRTNVECMLRNSSDQGMLDSWHPAARRNVRRAQKAGLSYEIAGKDRLGEFERLYRMTAERLGMDDFYRFDHDYFHSLLDLDSELIKLVLVSTPKTGKAIAAGILFLGGNTAYWHLGASDMRHGSTRPNDFLFFAMAKVAAESGSEKIVWGGGTSNDPADTLFAFKRHHGDSMVPVHIACRATNTKVYESACARWEQRYPEKKAQNNLFLKYRF